MRLDRLTLAGLGLVLLALVTAGAACAQDVTRALVAQYGASHAGVVSARVETVQSNLGTRYVELLNHPGVFWHIDEFVAFGLKRGRPALDAMPLSDVVGEFGKSLGTATVFRGMRLTEAELKTVLRTGLQSNALRYAEAPGNPLGTAGPEGKPAGTGVIDAALSHLSGPEGGDRFISLSQYVAISKAAAKAGTGGGKTYILRLEVPELSLVRVQRVLTDLKVTPAQVQFEYFGTYADLLDPRTELLAIDLVPSDSIRGATRSPFLQRLWELREMLRRFTTLTAGEMQSVLRAGVLTALAPATQFGRALREAGVYRKRLLIRAAAKAGGVAPGAFGGLVQKPQADLLREVLTESGVAPETVQKVVAKYGGASSTRALVLETNGVRVNLNQPYLLDQKLVKAGVGDQARLAILSERGRGEFRDLADFEVRMGQHGEIQGESAKTLSKVVDAGMPAAPGDTAASPKQKVSARLRDFLGNRVGGKSVVPAAAQKYFAGPMQNLLTIMVFQAALQYRATGRIDVAKAVSATLDSPQVWSGMAAAGLSSMALESLRASLIKQAGARAIFARMLGGLPGSIAAFAAWEVGVGYTNEALKGVKVPGKGPGEDVTLSDMFKHAEVAGQVMGNLARIAVNPKVQFQILGRVLKDRILTAEFFFTAAGMWAGSKLGTFAGVKVGALLGSAFGPVGTGIGAVAGGVVGGITGGVAGGFGGAWAGSAIDTWMARRSMTKAVEALQKAEADPAKRQKLGTKGRDEALDALDEARAKLVDKLSTDFAGKAKRYLSEKDLPAAKPGKEPTADELARRNKGIMSRQRQVEAARVAILDVYQQELDLLDKLIAGARSRGEDDAALVERENKVMMDMTMFLVGSSQVAGPLPDTLPREVLGEDGTARQETSPSYQGLPAPAY